MKPAARRVLFALASGPKTTHDLCTAEVGGVRFGARIAELRESGYVVQSERIRPGSHLYTLVASPVEVGAEPLGDSLSADPGRKAGDPAPAVFSPCRPGHLFPSAEQPTSAVLEDWEEAA